MVSTAPILGEQRALLQEVDWQCFEFLLQKLGETRATRLTYDQGVLEIMTPLLPHESAKCGIDRLIAVLIEELDLNVRSTGSLTCKREDLDRGAEPDTSYYIQNEPLVRGKDNINLSEDPPPDLVVEVEYSSSAINKLRLYAAMGVPEFWRYNGKQLRIYRLEGKEYVPCKNSAIFEPIDVNEIPRFLQEQKNIGEIPMIKAFRACVREKLGNY
ncbi:MAG: Uma2 family endonuclease [Xenococcaceae cyanobacterium]